MPWGGCLDSLVVADVGRSRSAIGSAGVLHVVRIGRGRPGQLSRRLDLPVPHRARHDVNDRGKGVRSDLQAGRGVYNPFKAPERAQDSRQHAPGTSVPRLLAAPAAAPSAVRVGRAGDLQAGYGAFRSGSAPRRLARLMYSTMPRSWGENLRRFAISWRRRQQTARNSTVGANLVGRYPLGLAQAALMVGRVVLGQLPTCPPPRPGLRPRWR